MQRTSLRYLAVLLALIVPASAAGQLISLKTVPVAAGDQFLIFPSHTLPMGGISIALDDAWLDPFVNPAMGARIGQPQFYSAPTFYSVSDRAGSARTLPVGGAFASPDWFGGVFAALQNLNRGDRFFNAFPTVDIPGAPTAASSRSATNRYAHVSAGRTVGTGMSVGASAFVADLSAIDGVEHLYANASGIAQQGNMLDFRVGLAAAFEGDRRLEAVLLHHRFNMDHDVAYVDFDFAGDAFAPRRSRGRVEHNQDHSRTWGAHVGYHQPIGSDGWRLGGALTANRKLHPKIPNYEIMNIPRDPGYSNAFNLGVGVSKQTERTTFGIDLIYEPAMSETWAEAEGPTPTATADTIPDGGKTVENSFDFSNAFINMGVAHDTGPVILQFGLRMSTFDYHLDQVDNVARSFRQQDETWVEWVPSWGLQIGFSDLELRYMGRVTTGTGRPGIAGAFGLGIPETAAAAPANDILLAPSGSLTLLDATVMTHQISISIPVR